VIFGSNMEVTGQLHAPATLQVKQPPGTEYKTTKFRGINFNYSDDI